jgi:5'-3' exonuclease
MHNAAMNDKKTLLLVDGSSYLYRAFHAMPDLRAVPGDPTSAGHRAIRGMINMMQALRKEVRADYAACVFDAKGPTFRDADLPEYKSNAAPCPTTFARRFRRSMRWCGCWAGSARCARRGSRRRDRHAGRWAPRARASR